MDRRDFFKILSTASTGVMTGACGRKVEHYLPLLVPEQEIVPGEDAWHPGVCGECEAGCGIIARVMAGERVVDRVIDGKPERFRERTAVIKKVEGNPLDSVSGGRLCARGQAAVQSLYHPDRLRGPLRREGSRGHGGFVAQSWDQAMAEAGEKLDHVRRRDPSRILFLARSQAGSRAISIAGFLDAIGAPPAVTFELTDFPLERKAAEHVYGWSGLPVYDLANAEYAIGIGADFLGTWASPVYYARQFGHFRQGRPSTRGRLVQAESRFSITAQSADQWLPIRPGTELQLALALGNLLLRDKPARSKLIPQQALSVFEAVDVADAARRCGIPEKRLRQVARELGESEGPLVLSGASATQTNSLAALMAAGYLNLLLGNVGQKGGVLAPASYPAGNRPVYANALAQLEHAQFVFLDGVDPLYTLPMATGVVEKFARVETVISFSPFLNDSATYVDLLLPDHHSLEGASAVFPAVAPGLAANVATPFVQPLYDTRATEQVLAGLAKKLNVAFSEVSPKSAVEKLLPEGEAWDNVVRRGGFWAEPAAMSVSKPAPLPLEPKPASFYGNESEFSLHFLPYCSVQFHDGRSAHLPWMQELPDPVSSAMWSLPVEVDPQTAARLGIKTGDRVRVESPHGKLEAPAYVDPAAIPGVVSMAIGQGHRNFGRYAANRGANPLSILAPAWEESTGTLATGATRVRLNRLGPNGGLVQFAVVDREQGPWGHR
ncbi:MAG TPA: molybdopterin-dependent oxidoreductase [Terriglobales bacterium]|nr:molybdopterin-dependent oxidoreductase [Terriglobales bacterium]